jgi:hypothetical protein
MLQDRYGKELGEPELGFLPVCSLDFPFCRGVWRRREAHAHTNNHARRHPLRFSLQAAARPIVAFGSFTSFPPSRRVRFTPSADIRPMARV